MAYLLRIWREQPAAAWRASLQGAHNQERAGFASLSELVAFIEAKTGEPICRGTGTRADRLEELTNETEVNHADDGDTDS